MNETTPATTTQAPSGEESAPALPTFDALPLSAELRATLAEMGYLHPTPVQLAMWEPATRGKDAVVQARTGTGKTASFGLPIIDQIVRRSAAHVQVLCLTPTRELALQVASELERLAAKKSVKVLAIYGGAPMPRQVEQINAGAQVVVGTPGRVLDHLRRGTLDPKNIRLLVLDEADEMLSMGFERELTAILETLPPSRQTLLFSATVPPDIERISKSRLKNPEFITLSGDHIGALEIDHFVYMVAGDKLSALIRMIEVENPESAIVFCNTKDETERVAAGLSRQGFDADWLNGDLPQSDRERVMTATREGRLRFLVATDVAARGIDISHLTHVINNDFPQDAETYVHRTGRTGRAGKTGTAISLITPRDIGGLYLLRLTYKIRPIEKQIPSEGELKTRAEADLVSMLAEAFASKGTHPEDLALARRILSHDQHEAILAGLLRDHLGARPTAQEEASAARRARPPAPMAPITGRRMAARQSNRPPRDERPAERSVEAPRSAPAQAPVVASPAVAAPAVAAPFVPAPFAPASFVPAPAAAVAAAVEREAPTTTPSPSRQNEGVEAEQGPQGDRGRRENGRGPRPRRGDLAQGPVRGRSRDESDRPRDPRTRGVPVIDDRTPSRRAAEGPRHADFVTWQPPEEEGDDQPILGETGPATPDFQASEAAVPSPMKSTDDQDFAELYVNVGRRDGARASDFLKVLHEIAGIDRDDVRRIRVRERNAFVSVSKTAMVKALEALTGATIAGKQAMAEQARERTDEPGAAIEDGEKI